MPVRSTAFVVFSGDGPDGLFVSRYQVPAGRTAIVHTFMILNESATALQVILAVRRGGTTCRVAQNDGLPGKQLLAAAGTGLVLNASDELLTFAKRSTGAVTPHSVFASGSLLDGVPT